MLAQGRRRWCGRVWEVWKKKRTETKRHGVTLHAADGRRHATLPTPLGKMQTGRLHKWFTVQALRTQDAVGRPMLQVQGWGVPRASERLQQPGSLGKTEMAHLRWPSVAREDALPPGPRVARAHKGSGAPHERIETARTQEREAVRPSARRRSETHATVPNLVTTPSSPPSSPPPRAEARAHAQGASVFFADTHAITDAEGSCAAGECPSCCMSATTGSGRIGTTSGPHSASPFSRNGRGTA